MKQLLAQNLMNWGIPGILVVDGNYLNSPQLYLKHEFEDLPLDNAYCRKNLEHIHYLWAPWKSRLGVTILCLWGYLNDPSGRRTALSSSDVNVVLVHDAWADGSSWAKVIAPLAADGIKVVAALIPLFSLPGEQVIDSVNIPFCF